MNFIEQQTPEKLRGGFYTDSDIARFLARWVLEADPRSILEPSCGDGAFLEALDGLTGPNPSRLRRIAAWELNPAEAAKARERSRTASHVNIEVHEGDFLKRFLWEGEQLGSFDAVVGNPPFVRYQYLADQQQVLAEKIFARFGLPFTKHTNAWVPFVIASLALLCPGGRLAMVIPSEILYIRHAQGLRRYLIDHCSRVLILDPEELWFENAQQGVVLLLAEKKTSRNSPGDGIAVRGVQARRSLQAHPGQHWASAEFICHGFSDSKWTPLLLSRAERLLLEKVRSDSQFATFADLAAVDVGIVTGANKFFLVTDEVVEAFGLSAWAHPMFGRSEHVRGLIYGFEDHTANRSFGLPTNFLWFDDAELSSFPPPVQDYLRSGQAEGLPQRFKCRVREPWFRVPSVYAAPVALLKRAHHYPRLILNGAGAFTTDTAYRVKPKPGTDSTGLVYSFLNSLTCLCAELEGRHYGGGVLELVPSEIERLLLPKGTASGAALEKLDGRFRSCSEPEILREQDEVVLGAAGLSPDERAAIHTAWDKLRNRRQRTPTAPSEVE